jgi:ACS family hexuronate transporter-like MFS transporter
VRWWIGGLLFASTVINYIDRQTLAVLAPFLKEEYEWSNADFATVLIAFRLAYTIGQALAGRAMDWLGTRKGLSITVAFYSTVACLTSLATGIWSFRGFRFLLGAGEAGNWPAATKAVSEWFPDRERGWAVALFDSGSSIGGAIAPFLVLFLYSHFDSWRPVFLVTGSLGFIWLAIWMKVYRSPEEHPKVSPEELKYIRENQASPPIAGASVRWLDLLRYKQTWGIVGGRALLDPYWFFIAEWFAIYLVSKGFRIEDSVVAFWVPFLAADLGNFFGGGFSSYLIQRGWPVGRARRTVLLIFGPSMLLLIPAAFTSNYVVIVSLFAFATFAYACCATIFLSLPADAFHNRAVASVSGLSGTGAGAMTLVTTYIIGQVADRFSFQPIIIVASIVPCLATFVLVTLVRAPKRPDRAGLLQQF